MDYAASTLLTGAGATAVMDLWTLARKRLLGVPLSDYGLVGRWIAYMPRGRFRHDRIAASRTPRPAAARLQSLVTHTIFGLGLYATAWLANSLPTL